MAETAAQRKQRLHTAAMKRKAQAAAGKNGGYLQVAGGADRGTAPTDFSDIPLNNGTAAPSYIGVPSTYTTPGTQVTPHAPAKGQHGYGATTFTYETTQNAPRYQNGAQYAPAGKSKEEIAALQRRLVAAGLLTGQFTYGRWDQSSIDAYEAVLAHANQAGIDENQSMQQFLNDPVGTDAKKGEARVIKLTSDADLIAIAEAVATRVRGRKLDPGEAAQFAAAFRASQAAEQNALYDASAAGGGTVSDVADPQVAAEAYVRKMHPGEAVATDRATIAESFLKVLQGGSPQTASY